MAAHQPKQTPQQQAPQAQSQQQAHAQQQIHQQAQKAGYDPAHVEGLARQVAAQHGGRDWTGFAQFILTVLSALPGLIGAFGGGGTGGTPNPNPGTTPPAQP